MKGELASVKAEPPCSRSLGRWLISTWHPADVMHARVYDLPPGALEEALAKGGVGDTPDIRVAAVLTLPGRSLVWHEGGSLLPDLPPPVDWVVVDLGAVCDLVEWVTAPWPPGVRGRLKADLTEELKEIEAALKAGGHGVHVARALQERMRVVEYGLVASK